MPFFGDEEENLGVFGLTRHHPFSPPSPPMGPNQHGTKTLHDTLFGKVQENRGIFELLHRSPLHAFCPTAQWSVITMVLLVLTCFLGSGRRSRNILAAPPLSISRPNCSQSRCYWYLVGGATFLRGWNSPPPSILPRVAITYGLLS